MPTEEQIKLLHKRYSENEDAYKNVYEHCQIVCEIALWCAGNVNDNVDIELLKTASLLHDIGSYSFMHDSYDRKYYRQHALFGAALLENEGLDKKLTEIIRTHILLGVTVAEIDKYGWKLPRRSFEPTSIEGKILAYADRYHSKKPVFNSHEYFKDILEKKYPEQLKKFEEWSKEFGVPDINRLAKKYGHPIR